MTAIADAGQRVLVVPRIMLHDYPMLAVVSISFSVVGGSLQELHRVAGASDIHLVLRQVASNLVVSITTVAVAVVVHAAVISTREHSRFSPLACWRSERPLLVIAVVAGGALGGVLGSLITTSVNFGWLVASSAAWMLIAAILVRIIGHAGRRIQRQADALSATVRDLQDAQAQLITSQTRTRRDISEQLHGPVQSELLTLESRLRSHGNMEDADALRSFRVNVIRDLSHRLHPMIVDVGLMPALDELADQTQIDVQITVSTKAAELDDFGNSSLPLITRLTIYRTVQEALLNAVTAGRATHAWININATDTDISACIADDGIGVDESKAWGVGLRSIDAWVRGLDGEWAIANRRPHGCQVEVRLPLISGWGP